LPSISQMLVCTIVQISIPLHTLTHHTHTCMQMLVYIVVQLVEDFESEATKPDAQDMAVGGKVQPVHL